jgi:hypothetical protein
MAAECPGMWAQLVAPERAGSAVPRRHGTAAVPCQGACSTPKGEAAARCGGNSSSCAKAQRRIARIAPCTQQFDLNTAHFGLHGITWPYAIVLGMHLVCTGFVAFATHLLRPNYSSSISVPFCTGHSIHTVSTACTQDTLWL